MNVEPHWSDRIIHIERRAQQRVKAGKQARIGIRKPTDPINLARLKRWHERLREQAIRRERMGMRR